MRNAARDIPASPKPQPGAGRFAIWTRRLLTVVIVLILWGASVLALEMAGPGARALVAGEGMLINPVEQK
jgi:hypothetical protein